MSSNAKFSLFAILSFIALQAVLSHPDIRFNPISVERDIIKNAENVVKDITKEIQNQESKISKEVQKLLKKAGFRAELSQCLREAHESVHTQLQAVSETVNECTNSVKESIRGALGGDITLAEMYVVRMQHKENIRECKDESKNRVRELRDEFRLLASQCVLG